MQFHNLLSTMTQSVSGLMGRGGGGGGQTHLGNFFIIIA